MQELAHSPKVDLAQEGGRYYLLSILCASGPSHPIHPDGDFVRLSFIIPSVQPRMLPSIVWETHYPSLKWIIPQQLTLAPQDREAQQEE